MLGGHVMRGRRVMSVEHAMWGGRVTRSLSGTCRGLETMRRRATQPMIHCRWTLIRRRSTTKVPPLTSAPRRSWIRAWLLTSGGQAVRYTILQRDRTRGGTQSLGRPMRSIDAGGAAASREFRGRALVWVACFRRFRGCWRRADCADTRRLCQVAAAYQSDQVYQADADCLFERLVDGAEGRGCEAQQLIDRA
jgi:hypothetical protein